MQKSPRIPARSKPVAALITTSIISFSLTLLVAGVAVLSGMIPLNTVTVAQKVDIGAALLFMPLCALVLAMISEVVRISLHGGNDPRAPIHSTVAAPWTPGRNEG